MSYEHFDPASDSDNIELGRFQNDLFVDNPMNTDLMPKIRFTTDAAEAAEAAKADRSNPLDLPDSVFYVEPTEDTDEEDSPQEEFSDFQNNSFGIRVRPTEQGSSGSDSGSGSGDYCGPSSAALDVKIENATRDLTFAQQQLERALETGTGVMTAMELVEHAQELVDGYVQQHAEAVQAEAKQAAALAAGPGKAEAAEAVKLGSVSHAEWELEQAYKSGNSVRIHNAERDLAHEKAKEKSKEMG